MTSLRLASIYQNQFSGTIPGDLANLRLSTLDLSSNGFSGGLPSFGSSPQPSSLQKTLEDIDLSGNMLTGEHHAIISQK
jgi:hypothetical protein